MLQQTFISHHTVAIIVAIMVCTCFSKLSHHIRLLQSWFVMLQQTLISHQSGAVIVCICFSKLISHHTGTIMVCKSFMKLSYYIRLLPLLFVYDSANSHIISVCCYHCLYMLQQTLISHQSVAIIVCVCFSKLPYHISLLPSLFVYASANSHITSDCCNHCCNVMCMPHLAGYFDSVPVFSRFSFEDPFFKDWIDRNRTLEKLFEEMRLWEFVPFIS